MGCAVSSSNKRQTAQPDTLSVGQDRQAGTPLPDQLVCRGMGQEREKSMVGIVHSVPLLSPSYQLQIPYLRSTVLNYQIQKREPEDGQTQGSLW